MADRLIASRLWALACAGLALACGGTEDDRPPPLMGRPQPHPLACGEIQSATVRDDGAVEVGGVAAPCAADDLVCPLPSITSCDAGVAVARCRARSWSLDCVLPE